jgi:PAS domain S-box-containing protein
MNFNFEQDIQDERDSLIHIFDKTPVGICIFSGPAHTFMMVNEQYKSFMGERDYIRRDAIEVIPEFADQKFFDILNSVYKNGKSFSNKEMPIFITLPNGAAKTSYFDVTFQPILDLHKIVTSVIQVSIDVTDRVSARKIAQDNFDLMTTLADNMPQIIWKADNKGIFYYTNSRWSEFTGETAPDKWLFCVHPEDLERTQLLWRISVESGAPFETEFRIKRTDGHYEWHLTRARPDLDNNGLIKRWYGTCTNTEEQMTLSQELSTAHLTVEMERQKFETLFHSAPAAMAILKGPTFTFERVNTEFSTIFKDRELLGKSLIAAIPEFINGSEFLERVKEVFNTGVTYSVKEMNSILSNDRPQSSLQYVDITCKRMNSADGLPYGIYIFATNVTEKVNARKYIQESETEFRALTEVMPQIIFTAAPNGDVTYFNERWESYTGISVADSTGWKWSHLHHPEDLDRVTKVWVNSLMSGIPYQIEMRLKGKDGQYRWFLARAIPTLDCNGKICKWIGTHTDIHEQKIISQKLESVVHEVKSSKNLAESANNAKSAFLANMSHEIRTPLGSIMGFLNLMRNPNLDMVDLNKYISIAERNSEQLLRIIDDILDLSKVEAGKLMIEKIDFNLTELLADISSLMEFRAQENGIRFNMQTMTELPEVINCDPTRIKQILMNAIGNAIKFTLKGTVSLQVSYMNSRLRFAIIDSGVGISEQQASQLFQAFTQADVSTTRKYGGTGLGLILTKRLCEEMYGEFYLQQSQVGVGSTFIATVKVDISSETKFFKEAKSHFYKPAKFFADKMALHDLKILVIDDLEDNLTLIKVLLTDVGAQVTTISNPYEGINQAMTNPFDIILMDIQMPLMNGYEVTKSIRQQGKTLPIIALTAHAMKEERMRALNFGFSGFLPKPMNTNDLIQTIKKLTAVDLVVSNKEVAIVEDDPDLRDLLEAILRNQKFNVNFMETGEELIEHLKTNNTPDLILIDLFLPKMSGSDLIPILNNRADRDQFKVVIASGSDEISSKVKNLKADGYLKKPYNSRSIVDSINAFLL